MLLYLMAILLTSCTDGFFLVPLFLYLSVASFPLISTSVPKENHEDSLKCCCPTQGSIDKRQKLVSINALCCVVILQHIFWLEKMCRVTIPGYRECQISCPSQDPDMAGFGKCLFFLLYVYMCFSRYMHTLTAVFYQEEIWVQQFYFMQVLSYI